MMVGDNLILASNSEINLGRLPPCAGNLLPYIYRVNHRLAFDKRADEPFIEAPNPYDDKQDWLKDLNTPLAGPIFTSALVYIVDSRGGVEGTTFEAKANDLKKI